MERLMLLIACGLAVGQQNIYLGNPDGVVFPGPISSPNRRAYSLNLTSPIETSSTQSLAVARLFNDLDSFEDILNNVEGIPEQEKDVLLNTRFGGSERTSTLNPAPARCIPELQTVSFHNGDHHNLDRYLPPCTRIKRCGGCCGHDDDKLVCEAVASKTLNFVVLVVRFERDKARYRSKEIIPLEEHTLCQCQCKVKPEHCTERQIYVFDTCECKCMNSELEAECKQNDHKKLWNNKTCSCSCRVIEDCNSGLEFDHDTCSCRQTSVQRTYFGDGTNYNYDKENRDVPPPVIIPLDASDPRRKHKDEPNY